MPTKRSQQAVSNRVSVERRAASIAEQRGPMKLDLALIDEDPGQPRTHNNPGFSRASLEELAATIRMRGIKTPVSVRDNPSLPGRYIINHGARRYRASRLAGQSVIPAFVDNDYNDVDQVIENLQRDELTAREIAEFIGRELAKGHKKAEIAHAMGKSAAFVTQHAALLDLPEPVALTFHIGRVRDVTVVNELVKCFRLMPDHTATWLADATQEITRGSVKLLREFLRQMLESGETSGAFTPVQLSRERSVGKSEPKKSRSVATQVLSPVLRVKHKGHDAVLLLQIKPSAEGKAWVRYQKDGTEAEVSLAEVTIVALISTT